MLPGIVDDLKVQGIPPISRKQSLQITLRLHHGTSVRQLPTLRQSVNVGIYRKRRFAKSLRHHDLCRFVTDSGETLQGFKIAGNHSGMSLNQQSRQFPDRFGLLRTEAAGADNSLNALNRLLSHRGWIRCQRKKCGSDLIHPCIRALSGKQDRYEQRIRISMIEWHRWGWI
jgi:hypothetical protein